MQSHTSVQDRRKISIPVTVTVTVTVTYVFARESDAVRPQGCSSRTHKHITWEDQCERHRMTRMTRPDCAVMCNLINTHTHTRARVLCDTLEVGSVCVGPTLHGPAQQR